MSTASAIFGVMENLISSEGAELQKKFRGIVEFNIKQIGTWTLDLKSPELSLKKGKSEVKPDISITLANDDFLSLVAGRLNPQQAFMKGKLQVKGNMGLAMKFNTILTATRKKLEAKYGSIDSLLQSGGQHTQQSRQPQQSKEPEPSQQPSDTTESKTPRAATGNISDPIFQMIQQTLTEQGPQLVQRVNGSFQFKLSGSPGVQWNLNLKSGSGELTRGVKPADVTIEMSEQDFIAASQGKLNTQSAFMKGQIKIKGKMPLAMKLNTIFAATRPKSRL